MKTFKCSVCGLVVKCLGKPVAHRCKNYKHETRQKVWVEVEK